MRKGITLSFRAKRSGVEVYNKYHNPISTLWRNPSTTLGMTNSRLSSGWQYALIAIFKDHCHSERNRVESRNTTNTITQFRPSGEILRLRSRWPLIVNTRRWSTLDLINYSAFISVKDIGWKPYLRQRSLTSCQKLHNRTNRRQMQTTPNQYKHSLHGKAKAGLNRLSD